MRINSFSFSAAIVWALFMACVAQSNYATVTGNVRGAQSLAVPKATVL
jgi:hypothetical protein